MDRGYREFKLTDIRGDWALADWGHSIAYLTGEYCGLESWAWQQPNATGWASMQLWVEPDKNRRISDAECVAHAIMGSGGPKNTVCVEAS